MNSNQTNLDAARVFVGEVGTVTALSAAMTIMIAVQMVEIERQGLSAGRIDPFDDPKFRP